MLEKESQREGGNRNGKSGQTQQYLCLLQNQGDKEGGNDRYAQYISLITNQINLDLRHFTYEKNLKF